MSFIDVLRQYLFHTPFPTGELPRNGSKKNLQDNELRALFVCSGNICRSPYAEARFRRLAQEHGQVVHTASCGTLRIEGRPAAPEMCRVALDRGLDLGMHRSRGISLALIDAADWIFVMEAQHRDAIVSMSPKTREKIVLLGSCLVPPGDVEDPMGRPHEAYLNAAIKIDEALLNWYKNRIKTHS